MEKKRHMSQSSNISSPSPSILKPSKMNKFTGFEDELQEVIGDSDQLISGDDMITASSISRNIRSSMSLHDKLDYLMSKFDDIDSNLSCFKTETSMNISSLQLESRELKTRLASVEGKSVRLEKKVHHLESVVENLEYHNMRQNLLIYGIKETKDENCYNLVIDFLKNELKIKNENIYSKNNLGGEVHIDVVHRFGQKSNGKTRPVIVKFVTRSSKILVLKEAKKLKGSDYSISDHFPSAMRERRGLQVSTLKSLRDREGESGEKVRLIRDKLVVGSKTMPSRFQQNPLTQNNPSSNLISFDDITHSDVLEKTGSYFQGHFCFTKSIEDASAVLSGLMQNFEVARSDHVSYAYTCGSGEELQQGHSDDGEYGASDVLLSIIDKLKLSNCFIAVSRLHSGPNLGSQRFRLMRKEVESAVRIHPEMK